MNDENGDKSVASNGGGEKDTVHDEKKRASQEVISSHPDGSQLQTKKQKQINDLNDSGLSPQIKDNGVGIKTDRGDGDTPARFASETASPSASVGYDGNKTGGIGAGYKDEDNYSSALSSACSSPIEPLSPQHPSESEDRDFENGAASVTSAASSNSSSSSFQCPPAPPTTPISAPYGGVNSAFYNVATPKPNTTTSPGSSGFPPLPSDEAMRGGAETQPHRNTSHKLRRRSPEISDDFETWNVGARYELMRILGKGSYGEVAQAKDLKFTQSGSAPKYVAIKRVSTDFQQDVDALRLFREIHLLRGLRGHDCIIQLVDIIAPGSTETLESDLYLVFECK